MQNVKNITGVITWMSGFVISLIVVVFPLGYYFMLTQYMEGSLESEAEINARIINRIISSNPKMWEYEQVRVQEYLSHRPRKGHEETRRVLNAKNEVIAESINELPLPVMTRSAELFDSGVVVGRIEISRSLWPLLLRSGMLMIILLPFGIGVFVILRNLPIHAVQKSADALRNERDTAQKYLDIAGVMFVVLDEQQNVRMINRKGCEVLGLPEREIMGRNWPELFIPGEFRNNAREKFTALVEGAREHVENDTCPVMTRGGGERTIAWDHIVLTDDSGRRTGTLSSGRDITEQQHLEAQLRHSQKMEAVGVLAGGVAHDFNNILTAIIGYASLLQMELGEDDPVRHSVDQILASADRAAGLTQSLLAFSRKQVFTPRTVKVNDIIKRVEKLLIRLLRADVEFKTLLKADGVLVTADVGQIEQVLMNLVTNARDAMPEGGFLSIETSRIILDPDFIKVHGYGKPGAYALLSIADTGMGMDEKTRERIFDPFFTTKETGKGTGLGLSIAYGIVKQHEGYITVYSEPGRGTIFNIYLPAVDADLDAENAVVQAVPARGTETVLLAEDDEVVRELTRRVLQDFGYTVIEAVDGEEAVARFSENQDRINLLVLDVVMPRKNGNVAYEDIKKIKPGIKVLFMSGYTADLMKYQGTMEAGKSFIAKPVSPREFLKKVRELLDQRE